MIHKRFTLILLFVFAITTLGLAQDKTKKPGKIMYKPVKVETNEVKLESQNGVSDKEVTKFKWIITNKSKDFLIVLPKECYMKSATAELTPNDKKIIKIRPLDSESKVIDVPNTKEKSMYEFNFGFSAAGIYKSKDASAIDLPDFRVPAQQNVIEEGDFRIEHVVSNVANDQWRVKLKITYIGSGLGIVDPRKISARSQSGAIIANLDSEKTFALQQGESENIIAIFQTKDPIFILWNDSHKEAQLEKQPPFLMDFEYDPETSK